MKQEGRKSRRGPRSAPPFLDHCPNAGAGRVDALGFTAVELSLAVVFLLVTLTGVYGAVNSVAVVQEETLQTTNIEAGLRKTIDLISTDLKQAADVSIDSSDSISDSVTYRVPVEVRIDRVVWGAYEYRKRGKKRLARPGCWQVLRMRSKEARRYTKRIVERLTMDSKLEQVIGDVERVKKFKDQVADERKRFSIVRDGHMLTATLLVPPRLKRGKGTNSDLEGSGDLREASITVHAVNIDVDTDR